MMLLDIGPATERLSECHISLILGVNTQQNRIKDFMQFACAILQVESAILTFEQEPYTWHYAKQTFQAIEQNVLSHVKSYFSDGSPQHAGRTDFEFLSQDMYQLGILHRRLIGFDLRIRGISIGKLFLFDQTTTTFDPTLIACVEDLIKNLITMLELHSENTILNEKYEQQLSLNVSKNKHLQIVSHDLRAPFHGLLGFTDVLLHEKNTLNSQESEKILHYLNDTLHSTYHLLESVLKWAMADGGRFIYHPINFKLTAASNIVCGVLSGLAKKKNIQLIDTISPETEIYADIHMITSVIQNLVSNALKFSPEHRQCRVTLSAQVANDVVHIFVSDTGLGMSEDQLEKIFEPTLKSSLLGTAGEVGTGLGLALCKSLVDLNLGEISVTSEKNKGTTFKVSLPIAISHQPTFIRS